LAEVVAWGVPHLSVYALTVEDRTPLARLVREDRIRLPDDGDQADMMFVARDALVGAGYEHYEVSSYARPGHRAVHNSGYWEMRPYLGLGAGAHGFAGGRRWSNLRRVGPYVSACLESGDPTEESETPDAATLAFERVMTGLRRLADGVELGPDWARYGAVAAEQARQGYLELDGTRARLTEQGLRYMNGVLLAFCP
jgi:oxygen-independent coproporphyrinogen-3 oxidase